MNFRVIYYIIYNILHIFLRESNYTILGNFQQRNWRISKEKYIYTDALDLKFREKWFLFPTWMIHLEEWKSLRVKF